MNHRKSVKLVGFCVFFCQIGSLVPCTCGTTYLPKDWSLGGFEMRHPYHWGLLVFFLEVLLLFSAMQYILLKQYYYVIILWIGTFYVVYLVWFVHGWALCALVCVCVSVCLCLFGQGLLCVVLGDGVWDIKLIKWSRPLVVSPRSLMDIHHANLMWLSSIVINVWNNMKLGSVPLQRRSACVNEEYHLLWNGMWMYSQDLKCHRYKLESQSKRN